MLPTQIVSVSVKKSILVSLLLFFLISLVFHISFGESDAKDLGSDFSKNYIGFVQHQDSQDIQLIGEELPLKEDRIISKDFIAAYFSIFDEAADVFFEAKSTFYVCSSAHFLPEIHLYELYCNWKSDLFREPIS